MSLADVVLVLRGAESPIAAVRIDPRDLPSMSRQLKRVRDEIAELKKEESGLLAALLAHPDAKVGYSNQWVSINPSETPDTDDERLIRFLKQRGYWEQVTTTSIAVTKLRALMAEDPEVNKMVTWDKSRTVRKR